jgi:hypothetical protein
VQVFKYPLTILPSRALIYIDALLPTASDQIHHILSSSNFLIEPELMNLLQRFELDCADLKLLIDLIWKVPISKNDEIYEPLYQVTLVGTIEKTMRTAVNIREWLTARADRHIL